MCSHMPTPFSKVQFVRRTCQPLPFHKGVLAVLQTPFSKGLHSIPKKSSPFCKSVCQPHSVIYQSLSQRYSSNHLYFKHNSSLKAIAPFLLKWCSCNALWILLITTLYCCDLALLTSTISLDGSPTSFVPMR